MNKSILMLASCAALLSLSSAAGAACGPYLSINAGVGIPNDSDSNVDGMNVTLESDPGLALTGAWGYDFGSVRLEAELAYQQSDLSKIEAQVYDVGLSVDASGETTSIAGMINGYYQFLNPTPFTPFVTAGLGIAKVELKDVAAMDEHFDGDDGTSLAYQVGAGCSYAVNPRTAIDVQYRYANVPNLEMDLSDSGHEQDVECSSNNIYAGLRFSF